MADDDNERTYRQRQRWSCYKFQVYRTVGRRVEAEEREWPEFKRFCVPRPGQYPGVEQSFRVTPEPAYAYRVRSEHPSRRRKTPRVSAALRKLKQDLKPLTGVRFAKVLGWGGNGLAALFFSEDRRASYRRQYFVVKVDIAGRERDSSGAAGSDPSSGHEFLQRELRIQAASLPYLCHLTRGNETILHIIEYEYLIMAC
jgi:hypothetical protein